MATTVAKLEAVLGADTDQFDRAMNKSEGRMKGMGKAAALGGLAIAGGLAIGLKKSVDAALESEKAQARLSQAMQSAGIDAGKFGEQIEKSIQSTSKLAAFDDEDLSDVFAKLARTTGSVAEATEGMGLAADIARARNISLEASAKLVEKAQLGNEQAFKKVGLEMEKGASVQETLAKAQEKFGGAAEAYGKTAAGAQERFGVAVENLQEKIGAKLLPILAKLMEVALKVIDAIERNWPKIMEVIGPVMDDVRRVVGDVTSAIAGFWDRHGETIMRVVTHVFGTIKQAIENTMTIIQGIVDVAMGIFTGDWDRAWDGIKKIVTGMFDQLLLYLGTILPLMRAAALAVGTAIKNKVVEGVTGLAGAVWDLITNINSRITEAEATIKGWGASVGNWVKNAVIDALTGIGAGAWGIVNNIWEFIQDRAATVKGWGTSIGTWIKNAIVDAFKGIGNLLWDKVKSGVTDLGNRLVDEGKSLIPGWGSETVKVSASPTSGVTKDLWDEIGLGQGMGLTMSSGLRPGDPGDHGKGKAIDMSGPASTMATYAMALMGRQGVKDVIYGGLGFWQDNGRRVSTWAGNEALRGDHYDHVHASVFDTGGVLERGWNLLGNFTGAREHLVPAGAGGVTNNYFSFPQYVGSRRELIQTILTELQRTAARN